MLKAIETLIRLKKNGTPVLKGRSFASLRGAHQGKSILIHGNGPSCIDGLTYAQQHYGEDLIIIGMNASIRIIDPDYYVLTDKKATLLYSHELEAPNTTLLISQQALKLVNSQYKKQFPDRYKKISSLTKRSSTVKLIRSKENRITADTIFRDLPRNSANAGIVSMCAAINMLTPKNFREGEVSGRIIVTGLDGYPLDTENIDHHINPDSPQPGEKREMNEWQNFYMEQLFVLADKLGIEVINTSRKGTLPANDLYRVD